jgi:hypothetical protein
MTVDDVVDVVAAKRVVGKETKAEAMKETKAEARKETKAEARKV